MLGFCAMHSKLTRESWLVAAALLTASAVALSDAPSAGPGHPWWTNVQQLGSDEFQGRLTGSEGYAKAAQYVSETFERYGLAAAGDQGYFQSVGYVVQVVHSERSAVTLTRAGQAVKLAIGQDLVFNTGTLQPQIAQGPLIFAGYGIHMPEAGYDDFNGLDIKGAIVVVLVGGPASLTGPQRAYALAETLPQALEQGGAAGVIVLINPKSRDLPWSRVSAASTQPGMLLEEPALRRFREPMLSISFNEGLGEALFAASGHTFAEILRLADVHKPLPHFALNASLEAHVVASTTPVKADNVVAELPGSDPALAGEALVVSAHLDHLGTGPPDHGDGIFRGVMDNASGVASLLEIARLMHESKLHPRRSILFLAIAGEEKGLLGSRYFAAHPTRHAGSLVADINMDAFLPLYPMTRLIGYGLEESSIGDDARNIAAHRGVQMFPDADPDEVVFVRSDQYSFIRRGIPAFMPEIAPRPGTAEMQISNDWYAIRYHAQADDLHQPVDLAAAEDYDDFIVALATRIANAPHRPQWHHGSFFARFQQSPLP
jgi:Zn-dependent M28 family amino/carboxypeptidase